MLMIFTSFGLAVVFTMHFLQSPLIFLSLTCSGELSFAAMMKIPLPFGIMIKTSPKFSRHTSPSPAGPALCRKCSAVLYVVWCCGKEILKPLRVCPGGHTSPLSVGTYRAGCHVKENSEKVLFQSLWNSGEQITRGKHRKYQRRSL